MVAHIHTVAFEGLAPIGIDAQVHITSGLPYFGIVGLPDKTVGESKDRIRSALNSIGLSLPAERIIVNLAPADIIKEGSHYDLPIALGLMVAMKILPADALEGYTILGELHLDGGLAPVASTLSAAIHSQSGGRGIICPQKNGSEACWAGEKVDIIAPDNILSLMNHLKGNQLLSRPTLNVSNDNTPTTYPDLQDIKGQDAAKRALEVAASGNHNLLMIGPPGSGKSMLASRLPGIIPELSSREMLDVSMISSLTNQLSDGQLKRQRPYRDPHHSCSMAAMVGGGRKAMPGEITLAHHGVLFLDELPEFPRDVLNSLRQPLETGEVSVARAQAHVTYPARFQLVAAMNPCRCGYLGDEERCCNKAPKCAIDYQSKISGPLFDRIDIHIEVPAVTPADMQQARPSECSADVAKRVLATRKIQQQRYQHCSANTNAQIDGKMLQDVAPLSTEANSLIEKAFERMRLSMRSYNRILRVARTIADMENSNILEKQHVAEALSYRQIHIKR